ncbi:hypothetical protein [Mucilaginibacter sp.]
MKNSLSILYACVVLAFTACKGNMHTESGDSTGTGSGGARTPGNVSADTTKHDSTNTSPKSAIYKDSTKGKADTTKK